jgi:hypothetical protein
VTDLGNREAPDMGMVFLLVFPVYYGDGFDGRCDGF